MALVYENTRIGHSRKQSIVGYSKPILVEYYTKLRQVAYISYVALCMTTKDKE